MEVTIGAERMSLLLNQSLRLGGNGLWLIPASIGVYLNQNKKTYLLASLALCYAIYPAFSGQFFPYHYIPFIYFIILLASLTFDFRTVQPSTFNHRIHLSSFILLPYYSSSSSLPKLSSANSKANPSPPPPTAPRKLPASSKKIYKRATPSNLSIGQAAHCLPCSKPAHASPRLMSLTFIFITMFRIHIFNPCAQTL